MYEIVEPDVVVDEVEHEVDWHAELHQYPPAAVHVASVKQRLNHTELQTAAVEALVPLSVLVAETTPLVPVAVTRYVHVLLDCFTFQDVEPWLLSESTLNDFEAVSPEARVHEPEVIERFKFAVNEPPAVILAETVKLSPFIVEPEAGSIVMAFIEITFTVVSDGFE